MTNRHFSRNPFISLSVFASLAVFALSSTLAHAEKAVVVLPFKGSRATSARKKIERGLKKKYTVVAPDRLQIASKQIGVDLSRGSNLAASAQHIGVSAVIGGALKKGWLQLAVYSGASGDAVVSKKVRWSKKPTRKQMRNALRVILRGIGQAPEVAAPVQGAKDAEQTLAFKPEPVKASSAAGTAAVTSGRYGEDEENPLAQPVEPWANQPAPAADAAKDRPSIRQFPPKVAGYVGFGIWTRSFQLTDQRLGTELHPAHEVGATATLRFAAETRPAAFFIDNRLADIFLRLQYQTTVGLKSTNDLKTASAGTTLSELLIDLGYDWNILEKLLGPRLRGSVGYGFTSTSFDWGTTPPEMPNTSYPFLLFNIGVAYPFASLLNDDLLISAHGRFNYRLVTSIGDISDTTWYGPGSGYGMAFVLGIDASYKNFVGMIEYTHSRYSLSFDQADLRETNGLRAAGGASDNYHVVMFSVGYSY